MKRVMLAATMFVLAFVLVAAAAQISRSEFDKLKDKVEALERQARENRAHINLLRQWRADVEEWEEEVKKAPKKEAQKEEGTVLLTRNFRLLASMVPGTGPQLRGKVKNVSSEPVKNVRIVFDKINPEGQKTKEYVVRTRGLSPGQVWKVEQSVRGNITPRNVSELKLKIQSIDYER